MFIIIAISIGHLTEWIVYKLKGKKRSTVKDTIKIALDSESFGNTSLNCDIYAITFISFAELDTLAPRENLNTVSLIDKILKKGDLSTSEAMPNSEKLANKNFSNCALIFFI